MAQITVICEICGCLFNVRPYRAKTARYCSRLCKTTSQAGKPAWNKKKHVEKHCEYCGTPYTVPPSRASTARFCSMLCLNRAIGRRRRWEVSIDPDLFTPADWAYLAGIIDGEGYICNKEHARPRLVIGNTSVPLMDWLMARLPMGKIRHDPPRQGYKDMHRFTMSGTRALLQVFQACLPYMVVKCAEAEAIIAALALALGDPPP